MARDATARLYDVDEHTLVFKKLETSRRYDQGTVTFRAREGKLIDLDQLHESLWATRLSGGTRSGLVSLQVTAVGRVARSGSRTVLKVPGSDAQFVLLQNPGGKHTAAFDRLEAAAGANQQLEVTGIIDNYRGRWPDVLQKRPPRPRRILITGVEVAK